MNPYEDGATRIARERRRQVEEEGWSEEHDDDAHGPNSLARAAAVYALPASDREEVVGHDGLPVLWPWGEEDWKPGPTRIRELEKAGALIAAEIDLLARSESTSQGAATASSDAKHVHVGEWCRACVALVHEMRVYARHDPFCDYSPTYPDLPVATCTCGFDAVLERYDRLAAD